MGEWSAAGTRGPRPMRVTRRLRGSLLKSTAITGGVLAALIAAQDGAFAACLVTPSPNTVACGDTTTTNTTNTGAFATTSNDKIQRFDNFGEVAGTVNAGATVDGFGLSILNQQAGTDANITFTNSGTVKATDPSADRALELITDGSLAGGTSVTATNTGTLSGNSNNSGAGAAGLSLSGAASFTVTNGGTINGETGISAFNVGAFDITTSGTVTGVGAAAIGGSVLNGSGGTGTVRVTGGTVSSNTADAIILNGGTSDVTARVSGGSVTTIANGTGSVVVQSTDGNASLNISGGTITAGGAGGSGASALSFGTGNTNATMSSGSIVATGAGGTGLGASSQGSGAATISMTGGTVTASGNLSTGVFASSNSGLAKAIIGANATVNATGPSSVGLLLQTNSGFVEGFVLGTLSATGAGSLAAEVLGPGGVVIGNGGTTGTLIGNVQLGNTAAQLIFNRSDAITYAGAISGQGGLEIGGGVVNLSGSSTYTNVTQIDSGATLGLKGGGSIVNTSWVAFASCGCGGAATFDISQTTAGASVGGLFDSSGTGVVALGSQTLTLTGNVGPYNGVIADGGLGSGTGGSIVVQANAVATFGGANTYTGTTTINNGGELDLAGTGSIATSSKLTNNGIFDISGLTNGGTSIKSLTGSGSVALGGNNLTLTNANGEFSGVIGGNGGLILNGGTQTLSGTNTYNGGTTIQAGTLQIANDSALGTGTLSMANGATLSFATNNDFTVANNIKSSGNTFFAPQFSDQAVGSTHTLNGVISDGGSPGVLNMAGTGTLVLGGVNTYTGGTVISSGTLRVTNNSSVGTGNVALDGGIFQAGVDGLNFSNTFSITANNGTIDTHGNILTIGGAISGPGALTTNDVFNGKLILTGTNTYIGGTTVNGGTLQIGNGATTGKIVGAATVNGDGTLDFTKADTTGITTITNNGIFGGAVLFRNSTSGASMTLNNIQGFVGFFDNSTAGSMVLNTSGQTSFRNSSSAGTAQIVNTNYLNFEDTSAAGNAQITNIGGNVLGVAFGGTATGGNATITNSAGGVISFDENSTGGNATLINGAGANGGTVDFSGTAGPNTDNKLTAGSITGGGNFYLGANELTLIGNASTTVAGVISDCGAGGNACVNAGGTGGSLVKAGTGTLTLTGANTYTGGTTINGGTLQLGGGGTSGSIAGNVVDNGILAFNRSDDITFGGVISGSGDVQQDGSGVLTLSGSNTYTGPTTVIGPLNVAGSIVSATTVNSGGTLMGTGSVGSATIQSGGTLLPGSIGAPGTLSVNGTLALNAGSLYLVQGAPAATFSRTNVSSTATLTGSNALVTFASGAYKSGTYTILSASGGLGGTQFTAFDTLGLSGTSGIRNPRLTYDANDVFLVLDPSTIATLSSFTQNQQGAATGINNAINGGANPNDSFNTLLGFTGGQLSNALTQLAGTTPGGATTAGTQLMNGFLSLMLHPSGGPPQQAQGGSGEPIGYAAEQSLLPREVADAYAAAMPVKAPPAQTPFASRWSTWAAAFGGTAHVSGQGDVGTADTDARAFAVAGGAKYKVSPDTALGFALAGGGTSWGLSQGLGSGGGDAFQIGGYGTHNFGAAYLSGAVAYAWHDMHTDRTVTAVGTEQLHAAFRAQSFGGRIEAGYRLTTPWVAVTPYGALQVQTFHTPAYSETAQSGPGVFALSYDSRNATATRTELGAWFDKPYAIAPDRVLLLRGRLAWAHDHSTDPTLNAVFQTLPGSNFTVNTTAAPADLALVSAGAELKFASNWSIAAKFDGEFSGRSQSYAGTGVIKRVW